MIELAIVAAVLAQPVRTFTAPPGDRTIHVSSSAGDDANAGTIAAPLRTLGAAMARQRSGTGDIVRLRRGDAWAGPLSQNWDRSGRSAAAPLVVGAYGPDDAAPPLIIVGGQDNTAGVYCLNRVARHVCFQSLDFTSGRADASALSHGVYWSAAASDDIGFEDCTFRDFSGGVILQGFDADHMLSGFTFSACRILDNYTHSHSQGVYAQFIRGVEFRGCTIDGNGWHAGQDDGIFAHGVYLHKSVDGFAFIGCTIARNSSHGLATGTAGEIRGNVIAFQPVGIQARPAGVLVVDNVVEGTRAIASSHLVGHAVLCLPPWGVDDDLPPTPIGPLIVAGNVAEHSGVSWAGDAIHVQTGSTPQLSGNVVHRWDDPAQDGAGLYDPSRTLDTYAALLGLQNSSDLLDAARGQRVGCWDDRLTADAIGAWLRQGYGLWPTADVDDGNGRGVLDGAADVNDLIAFLDWFAAGSMRADYHADGAIDVADLVGFLRAFELGT